MKVTYTGISRRQSIPLTEDLDGHERPSFAGCTAAVPAEELGVAALDLLDAVDAVLAGEDPDWPEWCRGRIVVVP